jgi:hypothetical protein
MGAPQFILLAVVAVVFGAVAQVLPSMQGARTRFDGIIVALVAFGTALIGNALKPYGPSWGGLYYTTAILIAAVWSVIVTLLLRKVGRKEPVY